ncbi:hypothetical protein ABVT39_025619 [Epinephelus coioides]
MAECTFGILAAQWRLYRRVLGVSPEVAEKAVKATYILHNFLHWDTKADHCHAPLSAVEQRAVQHLDQVGSNNASREAQAVRETFTAYFSSPGGAVQWQDSII